LPSDDSGKRSPEDVTTAELLDAAADTIVTLFAEVRRLSDDGVEPPT
jgi:predicted ATPase